MRLTIHICFVRTISEHPDQWEAETDGDATVRASNNLAMKTGVNSDMIRPIHRPELSQNRNRPAAWSSPN